MAISPPPTSPAEAYEVFQSLRPDAAVQHRGTVPASSAAEAHRQARQQFPAPFAAAELWLIPAPAISQVRTDDGLESSYALDAAGPEPSESEQAAAAYAQGEEDYAVFEQDEPAVPHYHRGMVRAASRPEALAQAELVFGPPPEHGSYWLARWADVQVLGPLD